MAFLSKEESLKLAKELGIEDAESLPWKELQSQIAAKNKELLGDKASEFIDEPQIYDAPKLTPIPGIKTQQQELNERYQDVDVMLAPELKPERYRLLKYDEELGDELDVVERKFDMNRATDEVFDVSGNQMDYNNKSEKIDIVNDYTTGTYRIKGVTGRKVVAMSSVPKENYGCGMSPEHIVPTVTWNGRTGYLWTHPTFSNVKSLLQQSGYYHEYKDQFKNEPNIWYVAGKTLACCVTSSRTSSLRIRSFAALWTSRFI